jgi:polyferredoxin
MMKRCGEDAQRDIFGVTEQSSTVKRYQGLRIARIAVSVAVAIAITLLWIEYSEFVLGALGWVEHTQIITAGLALSGVTVLFWLVVTSLFGRIYCSLFCPLGVVQDVAARIGRMTRRGYAREYHYTAPNFRLRYCALAVVVVCFFTGLLMIPALLDPYTMYSTFVLNVLKPIWGWTCNGVASLGATTGWWSLDSVSVITASLFGVVMSVVSLLGVSVAAWVLGRPFCNTLCPVGTVLGIVSARSLWHIDIDTDLCTNCRKCEHACKAQCINILDHVVDGSRCVNCFDCLTVCDDDAIFYRPDRKQLSIPMMQRLDEADVERAGTCSGTAMTSNITSTKHENTTSNETIS